VKVHSWFLLRSGPGDPAFNMALDEALLMAMPRLRRPVLRFYGWSQPAASFGYFQNYSEVERATRLRPLVRRPTGGGIVPHDADWTYSLAIPAGHDWHALRAIDSYRRVHEWIRDGFAKLRVATELAAAAKQAGAGECFAGHERFDVLWRGKKIAGAAQRRTRDGLLIQGSIQPPPRSPARSEWEQALCEVANSIGAFEWNDLLPDDRLRESAEKLVRRKYSRDEYTRKR
jgi:lipoyl(octanoyl) transferase